MTAPHNPTPPEVEGLAQTIVQAFGAIADHIQTITGMTPLEIQNAIDQLPDEQRAQLINRIQGQIPPMG